MVESRGVYLCWYSVSWAACAGPCCLVCGLAVRVASLYHESLNDTVEQRAIVESIICQFDKIVAVEWCLVVQTYDNIPFCGIDSHSVSHKTFINYLLFCSS